jgi:acyl transferase domain-containing protein
MATENPKGLVEPIAVIAMQGRFPGAPTLERFWQNLLDGVESLRPFTDEEVKAAGIDESWTKMPGFVPAGTVLDDVELFDAPFFGFSARDAEIIDPQQRIFLETAWEAVERAGYDPDTYPGSIGVFGGSEQSTYFYQLMKNSERLAYADPTVLHIGNDKDYLTTLVSYKLNLKGPSVAVQTACSTSLVAVGLACQSLWSHQSDMALAGGVSVGVPQRKGYWYMPGGIFSPDGHCRTFDASGQGTVVGNGVGIVLLKRLSDALADGDEIHAVIKGAAINNDGAAKVGFSAPSVEGQVRAIRTAQRMAGIDPCTIGYVEAHGTATLLGDPIEVAALNEVFQATADRRGWCAIGSLKSNVGHLASAAGVAGLIKAILCLKHRTLVPSLNFVTPNPQIDFANGAFYVSTEKQEWPANGVPRRAGVSSFGVGGTNAHVVVEEAPRLDQSGPSRGYQLLLLSAKTATALDAATANMARHLDQHPDHDLADVAFTTQLGRRAFGHRRVLLATRGNTAAAALTTGDPQFVMTGTPSSHDRPLAFMFSGQGTQYVNMCRDLYRGEPAFRSQVDDCCERLAPHLGFDLRDVLYPPEGLESEAAARIVHTSVTQPALFTVEYALARLLMRWGLTPKAMLGHSIGEYVAACISGVFSLEDALALVAIRGRLMEEMPPGSMLAVPLSASEAQLIASTGVSLAAVNAPYLSVLSGPTGDIDRIATQLAERGLHVRRLQTSHAFHSSMMDEVLERFTLAVASVERHAPAIPFLSNVTGTWISADQAQDPEYWSRHLRSAVQFAGGLDELMRVPDAILLEVGPGHTLQTLVRQQPAGGPEHLVLGSIRAMQDPASDVEFLLKTIARLWLNGQQIDWRAFSADEKRRRVDLPTYPFERQKYWIGPGESSNLAAKARDVAEWFYVPSWKPDVGGRPAATPAAESRWVIFCDALGVGEEMARQLRRMGHAVTTVIPAHGFSRIDEETFGISPDTPGDYVALLETLGSEQEQPQFVAHLWSVTGSADADFDDAERRGASSLTCLAQALEKQRMTDVVNIAFVSDHLQSVLGDEQLCPSKATALGACKVLPQEYPNLRCRAVDVAVDASPDQDRKLAEVLIGELTSQAFEAVVAYRKGRRWVQTFERSAMLAVERPRTVRDGGVYVITGGLGNIGLVAAEVLTRASSGARLALVGRSAFPDREDWDQWLASEGVDAVIAGKIRRLKALEDLGATVNVFSVDVSDADQMAAVIAQIEAAHGPINGVVHGAGNTSADGFMPASQVDAAAFERQLRPKARGLLVLEELLRGKPLDFWLLLSSISGVLGGLNLLPYASANVFLDAFAARQNQAGTTPWISVNWDAWQFPADERAFRMSDAKWFEYVLPTDGASAFQRILDRAPGQIVVSVTDLQNRLAKWVKLESLHEAAAGPSTTSSVHQRPNLSSQYVAPRTETEKVVAKAWEQLLGVAPIGIHDKFFELGGHSLLAIQLIAKIRESFRIELPPQRLFEAPTVAQFAATIEADVRAMKEQTAQQEAARMAELLDLVEGLTEDQVVEMLANAQGVEEAHG